MLETFALAESLAEWARTDPERTALIQPGSAGNVSWERVTFAELNFLADRYAAGLSRAGVRRRDRVLYMLQPSAHSYAVFYALLRLGAVPAFIDPRMPLPRLLECVSQVRPRVVIAVPLFHALRLISRRYFVASELCITSGRRWSGARLELRRCLVDDDTFRSARAAPDDECYLPFTSGSTGLAKGVICTYQMVREQVKLAGESCRWREGMSVVMCFAPFAPYAMAHGMTAILPRMDFSRPAACNPRRIVEAVLAHGAQCAFASPVIWTNLIRYCEREHVRLSTLLSAAATGAPVQPGMHRKLSPIIHPEGTLLTPYGATEAMPLSTADTTALADTWHQTLSGYGTCVGKPLTGIEVNIIRVTDEPIQVWSDDLRVPLGTIGEIAVAGPVVSPAYLQRPADTALAKITRNGSVLHRTGDLGRLDAQGRLWFCGRKAHRIQARDGMLAPVPIENIFNEHPGVHRSAVVGVGQPGEQIAVACLELESGSRFSPRLIAELEARANATIFGGVVTRFLRHDGFPVDPRHNSKINRATLAAWATGKLASRFSALMRRS